MPLLETMIAMASRRFAARLHEVARDRGSGAREILSRLLKTLAQGLLGTSAQAAQDAILEAARIVAPRQPSMAPILHTFEQLFQGFDASPGVHDRLEQLALEHRTAGSEVVRHAAPRLEAHGTIATLSWSSTVLSVLAATRHKPRIVIAESRPGCEGRRTASRLASEGHEIVFHPDSTFPSAAAETGLLLLGGDALVPSGLVNKVGSLNAARACQLQGTPVVAVLDQFKILGSALARRLRVLPESPSHVWGEAPATVDVRCRYFERVPLDALTCVWGISTGTSPAELLERAEASRPSPWWREVPLAEGGLEIR